MKYFVALFLAVASTCVCAGQADSQSARANGATQVVNAQGTVQENAGDLAEKDHQKPVPPTPDCEKEVKTPPKK